MTLIAGTVAWKGICIGADTRATYKNHTPPDFSDDVQKIDILKHGLGIAVAGSCDVASVFREVLERNLDANQKTDNTYEGPANIIKEIILQSLRDTATDPRVLSRSVEDTAISGLIFGIDKDTSLHLNTLECAKILNIIGDKTVENSIWTKYSAQIKECASGHVEYIELSDLPNSILYSFESVMGSINSPGILKVKRVPFGEIAALGSGRSDDHEKQQNNTLFYLLFQVEPDQIDDSAFHILRTHGWSEKVVPAKPRYNFQTFGGGYLSGAFLQTPEMDNNVTFRVAVGEIYGNQERTVLICSVYENKNGELCIRTRDGKDWILKKFWEYGDKGNINLSL